MFNLFGNERHTYRTLRSFVSPFQMFDTNLDVFDTMVNTVNTAPTENISEGDRAHFVSIDMPGVKKESINVSLKLVGNKNLLTVEGKRSSENNDFTYRRKYTIHKSLTDEDISAKLEDGVLVLTINKPKKEEESTEKKIKVE